MPAANEPASDKTPSGESGSSQPRPAAGASAKPVKETRARAKATKEATKREAASQPKTPKGNPRWLAPTILALLAIGFVWVIVFYLTASAFAWPGGNLNLAGGFVLMLIAGILSTRLQ